MLEWLDLILGGRIGENWNCLG